MRGGRNCFDAVPRRDPVPGFRERRTRRRDASAPSFRHDVRVDRWVHGALLHQRHQRDRPYNHQSDQHGPSPNSVLSVGGGTGRSGVGSTWRGLPKGLVRPGFRLAVLTCHVASKHVGPCQATALQELRDKLRRVVAFTDMIAAKHAFEPYTVNNGNRHGFVRPSAAGAVRYSMATKQHKWYNFDVEQNSVLISATAVRRHIQRPYPILKLATAFSSNFSPNPGFSGSTSMPFSSAGVSS
jgi:hypothetical protein